MVEGARLESVYTATYRGFESLLLRHTVWLLENLFPETPESHQKARLCGLFAFQGLANSDWERHYRALNLPVFPNGDFASH